MGKAEALKEDGMTLNSLPDYRHRNGDVEYPDNLLLDLGVVLTKPLNEDQMDGLSFVLSSLTGNEQRILDAKYRMNKPQKEIAFENGVTEGRITQIRDNAIKKLKHPARLQYVTCGYSLVNNYNHSREEMETAKQEMDKEIANYRRIRDRLRAESKMILEQMERTLYSENLIYDDDIMQRDIKTLKLSVRTANRLRSSGFQVIGDLERLSRSELRQMRGLGTDAVKEIEEACRQAGIALKDS